MGFVDFVKRHKRKLLAALGVSAGLYWLVGFAQQKIREVHEQIVRVRLAEEDLERRFEQNQRDATFTTMALLPTLSTQVLDRLNVEAIKRELQDLRSDARGTAELATSQELAASQELEGVTASSVNALNRDAEAIDANAPSSAAAPGDVGTGDAALAQSSSLAGSKVIVVASKSQLWNQIKVASIARALVLLYSEALLTLFTRIQLNILGRKAYLASIERVVSDPDSVSPAALAADEERFDATSREYLTFSWWLLNRGWKLLAQRIESATSAALEGVDPRERFSSATLSTLLGRVHAAADEAIDAVNGGLVPILLPPHELETEVLAQTADPLAADVDVDADLRAYLDETETIIRSESATEVLQNLVHAGISVLMKRLDSLFENPDSEVRLAAVLMLTAKQAHQMAAGSPLSNEYVDAMIAVPLLDALSATVYSNY